MSGTGPAGGRMTPLEMAQNAARHVFAYARAADTDPMTAHLNRVGERAHEGAKLAAAMAIVSIAEDLHRIADLMVSGPAPDYDPDFTETGPPLRNPSGPPS